MSKLPPSAKQAKYLGVILKRKIKRPEKYPVPALTFLKFPNEFIKFRNFLELI